MTSFIFTKPIKLESNYREPVNKASPILRQPGHFSTTTSRRLILSNWIFFSQLSYQLFTNQQTDKKPTFSIPFVIRNKTLHYLFLSWLTPSLSMFTLLVFLSVKCYTLYLILSVIFTGPNTQSFPTITLYSYSTSIDHLRWDTHGILHL